MSITDFLLARIAEDEALARAALTGIHGEHETSRDYAGYVLSSERDTTEAQDEFIETFWPARILAECEAKRAIVGMHQPMKDDGWASGGSHGYLWCSSCGSVDYDSPVPYPCDTIRTLAAVYADHDEYQDEWKVGA